MLQAVSLTHCNGPAYTRAWLIPRGTSQACFESWSHHYNFVPPLKPLEIEITESLWPASSPRHAHRRSQTKPDLQSWSLAHHRRALGRLCFSTVLSRKFFRRIYIHLLLHRRDSPVTDAEILLRSRPTYYSVQASPSSSSNRNHWSQAFSADGR
ncbi:hypothetical protein Bca52824_011360 [Brassica carinata]|uniref:Uncharacterized protein n=1 Tax=Brassica carinata TaxID=52824 RepID=A0A8X8BC58_BRACI|nr:hypothetical protein Bca52824_011360 [Brassica carinata]